MSSGDEQYGGWCTNWAAFDVPTLWKMIENEGRDENYEQSGAWDRTYELLAYHMNQLQHCRDDLAAKWPPQQSPAAGVFLDYIDNLIGSMKQMSDDSLANGSALSGINSALVSAREQIRKLNDEWQHYQSKEEHPDKLLGLIPLGADVPDDWRQKLTYEAAKHMVDADTQVFQHTSKMVVPTPYQVQVDPDGETWSPDGSAGGNARTVGNTEAQGGQRWARPLVIPPPPVTQPPPEATMGPILSGGVSTTPSLSGPGSPAPTPLPVPSSPTTGGVLSPGVIGQPLMPFPKTSAPESGTVFGRRPASGVSAGRSVVGDLETMRGRTGFVAPGGVIGGEPMAAHAVAIGGSRTNPVGGVTGRAAAGSSSTAGSRRITNGGATNSGGATGRRLSVRGDRASRFDPDNPWAVAGGVPSVIEPIAEPESHEPGPGVIGIDR